jgi:four helix bundle protein
MAQYEHLPIYKKAMDIAVYIENIVKGFSRYHKYTLGADLRNQSRAALRLIVRANSEADKLATLTALRDAVEELKITVRLCKETKAFKNFNSFKHLAEELSSLSRQSEGWLKSIRGQK